MLRHFKNLSEVYPKHKKIINASDHLMPHLSYARDEVENLKVQHFKPIKIPDWLALMSVKIVKLMVNILSGYGVSKMTEKKWLTRSLIFQTLSGVPAVVGAIGRHMRSLRVLKQDNGWIQELLQQADNQRFHFMTFVQLRKPNGLMRMWIGLFQPVFALQLMCGYMMSSRYAHKYVGYFQEQVFLHYTDLLKEIDRQGSPISNWKSTKATDQAIQYYKLSQDATLRDMVLMIRADELIHNEINHLFGEAQKTYDLASEKDKMYTGKVSDIISQKINQKKE